MKRNASFIRKVIYLSTIAVLFIPLSLISAPAKNAEEGGGVLSQMRRDERLNLAQLGKVDPASASMSLATLGMRGVAANLLWSRATHYKKTENWDAFKATLNQVAKLQPNFVSVWQFQSWNISYNVSVEFDDFRHRYHWVKKGVDYLIEGNEYNRDEPVLLWDTGWFFGHKMGRADEYRQFRNLFREDEDFHATLPIDFKEPENQGPDHKPDNWKAAHVYFTRAQVAADRGKRIRSLASMGYWNGTRRIIDKKDTGIKGKNPLVFHSDPPKALINYADAIEEDGYLDEVGRYAWEKAGEAWDQYGDRTIISSFGVKLRLNDRERNARELEESTKQLEAMVGGLREKLAEERKSSLTEAESAALKVPKGDRNLDQQELVLSAEKKLNVGPLDLANMADPSIRDEARSWAKRYLAASEQVRLIDRYRGIVNFIYWRDRCKAEQTPKMIEARKLVLKAGQAFDDSALEEAREYYEDAWDLWAEIFDEYTVLVDDVEGEIIFEAIQRYQKLLGQFEESFPPKGFKLMKVVQEFDDGSMLGGSAVLSSSDEESDGTEIESPLEDGESEGAESEDGESEDGESEEAEGEDAETEDAETDDGANESADDSAADAPDTVDDAPDTVDDAPDTIDDAPVDPVESDAVEESTEASPPAS